MRIVVAMSGGVDSSSVAWMLKEEGHEVVGCTFDLWPEAWRTGAAEDARRVCVQIGAPHRVVRAHEDFEREVIAYFRSEYLRGRTPNPCVRCNPRIKFALLLRLAQEVAADAVATGHYARVGRDAGTGRFAIRRAICREKDQSYVLHGLSQGQLSRVVLPLGQWEGSKDDLRRLAGKAGLKTQNRPDSQEVCFVPDGDYAAFVEAGAPGPLRGGNVVDMSGNVLGRHKGVHRFTIGQRRGLGVAVGYPLYVVRIDAESGEVLVGPRNAAESPGLCAGEVHWVSVPPPEAPFRAEAQIRYAHRPAPCTVEPLQGGGAKVLFDEPQSAVTPGQAAVFYDGDLLLGGGTIEKATAGKQ